MHLQEYNISSNHIGRIKPANICVFCILFYIFFSQIISVYVNYSESLIWFGCVLEIIVVVSYRAFQIKGYNPFILLCFFILIGMYCFHNSIELTKLNPLSVMGTFLLISLLVFCLPHSISWISFWKKIMFLFSFFHVMVTILMAIFSPLGDMMIPLWKKALGSFPQGTENGLYNYRVGFTLHFSANSIFCTCSLLISFSNFLSSTNPRDKRKWILCSVISLIGIFLTAKRAHLVFGILVCAIAYIVANYRKRFSRVSKAIIFLIIFTCTIYILRPYIPQLTDFFERFINTDFTNIEEFSSGRTIYWELCILQFLSHPLSGIGWYGFRDLYQNNLYSPSTGVQGAYLDAHNVYIQLLCETGIIGFACYMIIVLFLLITTISLLKRTQRYEGDRLIREGLLLSFSLQLFYLSYSLTGNCLYDFTYYIYILAVCAMLAVKRYLSKT